MLEVKVEGRSAMACGRDPSSAEARTFALTFAHVRVEFGVKTCRVGRNDLTDSVACLEWCKGMSGDSGTGMLFGR
jgi:hypothetical protein